MAVMDTLGRFKHPEKAGQTPFTDTTDRCERLGYVPSHKRMASLISAGLSLQVTRDELWDFVSKQDPDIVKDLPPVPPLRRHLDADLADLSQTARTYQHRRRLIEERVRAKQISEQAKLAGGGAGLQGPASSPAGGAAGAPEGASGKS